MKCSVNLLPQGDLPDFQNKHVLIRGKFVNEESELVFAFTVQLILVICKSAICT